MINETISNYWRKIHTNLNVKNVGDTKYHFTLDSLGKEKLLAVENKDIKIYYIGKSAITEQEMIRYCKFQEFT